MGSLAAESLVNQEHLCSHFEGQGNGFGFSGTQVLPEGLHQRPVGHCAAMDPEGTVDLGCAWLSRPIDDHVLPHRFWHQQLTVQRMEQL